VCFAPEADALVGGIVIVVGVDALRHAREPKQIPLAALPLLFGVHQVSEAFVWWGLQGHVGHAVERIAVWTYLLFALGALPVLIPLAVGLVEPLRERRRIIAAFGLLGLGVGGLLTIAMFRGPLRAMIEGRQIEYDASALTNGGQLTGLYVVATCGALIASSYRDLAVLGVLNLVAVPVLMWLTVGGFISLWCFWAAIVSILIDRHLRHTTTRRLALVA
jgi:uncharacterized protein DUF6629